MKPFIREVGRARLAPVGWMAQPAGEWAGREIEIVFDPDRHQVVKFTEPPSVLTKVAIAAHGFRPLASAGRQEMGVRDEAAGPGDARRIAKHFDAVEPRHEDAPG